MNQERSWHKTARRFRRLYRTKDKSCSLLAWSYYFQRAEPHVDGVYDVIIAGHEFANRLHRAE